MRKLLIFTVKWLFAGALVVFCLDLASPLQRRAAAEGLTGELVAGAALDPNIPVCAPEQSADLAISNGDLTLKTRTRVAGAVDSLIFRGKEYINSYDHGRQLQYALSIDGYSECNNPTEAGSNRDAVGPASTSKFLEGCTTGSSLYTHSKLAYWLRPGEAGHCRSSAAGGVNRKAVSDFELRKWVNFLAGKPSQAQLQAELMVPEALGRFAIEAPTIYLRREFSEVYSFAPATGKLQRYLPSETDPIYGPFNFVKILGDIPILSTVDGRHAIALVGKQIDTYAVASYTPAVATSEAATHKISVVHSYGPTKPGRYIFEAQLVVGTVAEVQQQLSDLAEEIGADNYARGAVSSYDCNALAGWACKTSGTEALKVRVYRQVGRRRILIGETLANLPRNLGANAACTGQTAAGFNYSLPTEFRGLEAGEQIVVTAIDPVTGLEKHLPQKFKPTSCKIEV